MNIDFYNIYNKSIDLISKKAKTIIIAIVALIFSFETSNVILEIVFADRASINQSASVKMDINKINKNPFFQEYESQEISNLILDAIKAPETSLSLKLFGVTSSEDQNFAIIGLNKSDQGEYLPGDTILDNVFLESIHKDYVTLNRAGVSESLSFNKVSLITGLDKIISQEPENIAKKNKISAEWLANQNLLDAISFVPIFSDGTLSGLEVNPGDNEEFFSNLELLPGDILVSINGLLVSDLTENYSSNLETLFKDPKDLNLEILRNNDPISIGIIIN
ncbi:MAG: type II secretion system protein N [Gammaproteobacteria bacterium]|tara:strand:+ start:81 stop:914 length:834 start_codon:yes stop_codon:yes gene_type:complete